MIINRKMDDYHPDPDYYLRGSKTALDCCPQPQCIWAGLTRHVSARPIKPNPVEGFWCPFGANLRRSERKARAELELTGAGEVSFDNCCATKTNQEERPHRCDPCVQNVHGQPPGSNA